MKFSLIFLPFAICAQHVGAIEMTDYKLAESFYDESYVGLNFDLKDGNQDQTSYNGTFTGSYNARKNAQKHAWSFRASALANLSKGPNDGDESDESYELGGGGYYDHYLERHEKLLIYGSADAALRKLIGQSEDDPFVKVGAGLGYGRIYDATPLAKTLRIVEDLVDYEIISMPTNETLLAVAQVIDRESEFKSKYGLREYKKFWFEAIESAFRNAGVIKGTELGAFGIIRLDEILFQERLSPRYHGWIVRGGVGQILSNYDGESTDATLDVMFEYGLPIGHRAQFHDIAKYSTILADDVGHIFTNDMTYTYEIMDAIDWENKWAFRYDVPSDERLDDVTTHTLSSTFRFYIANRLSLDTTLSLTGVEDHIDDNDNDDLETRLNFGVTYRLK